MSISICITCCEYLPLTTRDASSHGVSNQRVSTCIKSKDLKNHHHEHYNTLGSIVQSADTNIITRWEAFVQTLISPSKCSPSGGFVLVLEQKLPVIIMEWITFKYSVWRVPNLDKERKLWEIDELTTLTKNQTRMCRTKYGPEIHSQWLDHSVMVGDGQSWNTTSRCHQQAHKFDIKPIFSILL